MLRFPRRSWTPPVALALALTGVACGGTAVHGDDHGSASGGHAQSTGGSSGGTAVGGSSTGSGNTTGSGGANTGGSTGLCNVDADCVAAYDTTEHCYNPLCSSPVAVSWSDVKADSCLVTFEDHRNGVRSDCTQDPGEGCPEGCAQEPACAAAHCSAAGRCELQLGYTAEECGPSSCEEAEKIFDEAVAAATACDPAIDSIQCDGTATVHYWCGCFLVLNETKPELVKAAQVAATNRFLACPTPPCLPDICEPIKGGYCSADGVCAAK